MDLTKTQLARAQVLAGLAQQAARDIDQAGRGLAVAMEQCASNTPDIKTVQILTICMAYLNNSMTLILEGLAGDEVQAAKRPEEGIVLPSGERA
jgi:hypothetical protein